MKGWGIALRTVWYYCCDRWVAERHAPFRGRRCRIRTRRPPRTDWAFGNGVATRRSTNQPPRTDPINRAMDLASIILYKILNYFCTMFNSFLFLLLVNKRKSLIPKRNYYFCHWLIERKKWLGRFRNSNGNFLQNKFRASIYLLDQTTRIRVSVTRRSSSGVKSPFFNFTLIKHCPPHEFHHSIIPSND